MLATESGGNFLVPACAVHGVTEFKEASVLKDGETVAVPISKEELADLGILIDPLDPETA